MRFVPFFIIFMNRLNESKKESKDQESIQSSTTPDPGYQWESDNFEPNLLILDFAASHSERSVF